MSRLDFGALVQRWLSYLRFGVYVPAQQPIALLIMAESLALPVTINIEPPETTIAYPYIAHGCQIANSFRFSLANVQFTSPPPRPTIL